MCMTMTNAWQTHWAGPVCVRTQAVIKWGPGAKDWVHAEDTAPSSTTLLAKAQVQTVLVNLS